MASFLCPLPSEFMIQRPARASARRRSSAVRRDAAIVVESPVSQVLHPAPIGPDGDDLRVPANRCTGNSDRQRESDGTAQEDRLCDSHDSDLTAQP